MTRPTRRQLLVGGTALLLVAAAGAYMLRPPGGRAIAAARGAAARRDFPAALELLKEPLDHPRADPDALLLGARTARRAGRTELADRYLRRYVERGGDAETAAIERILGGIQRGELSTFAGGLRFCEKNPGHPETSLVLEAMAQGYLKAGHLVGAIDAATRWLATDPPPADKAQALVWRGNCYRSLGNLDQALADARAALAAAPEFIDAHALAADTLTGSDPDAAVKHYAVVLAADPDRAEARLGVARCHRNRGEAVAARGELDRVLAANPRHVPALVERARLALDAKEYDAAARDLHEALAFDSRSRDALTTLARVHQLAGREKEAAEARAKVKAIEEELFKVIRERVASGMIPAPPPGTDLTAPAAP